MKQHHIYWWNLENLFDIENSPDRPDWFQKTIKNELKGWSSLILEKKLTNLCQIISQMNQNQGPDILGVCEIENEAVVVKLMAKVTAITGRNYAVLHQDTKDKRGIDIAVIYDADKYTTDGKVFSLEIMKRNSTRDLFQVALTTQDGNELVLIGNHWPSRMGGKFESEPYRMMVAETLSYWIDRIHEIKLEANNDKNPAIVIMGDFNDNPYDRSITDYLRATGNIEKVKNARSHVLFNLMYPFLDAKYGTHVYGSELSMLDQFIVSKSLVVNSANYPFQVEATNLLTYPELVKGDYNTPIRFGRPSSKSTFNEAGFSDHLPIELIIEERE